MGLSNDLVSQFVKATKDTDEKKRTTTVYGTLVKVGETVGVMLDGSEVITPVSTLADYSEGDRVMVNIDNHNATIIGNITSPSARVDDVTDMGDRITANEIEVQNLYANRITTDYLKANYAEIGVLDAAKARITDLEARSANIEELKADKAEITELDAKYASIEELEVVKANITSLDSKYVNIDYTNVNEASIKKFYAKFGMMDEVVISNGKVTGTLVGVTIDGDLIQAGTLVADKLVIRTEDGLLYKLNADALGEAGLAKIEDLETLKNGLHGAIINDKTIVAEKIKVDDLVAFGATIGGFKIESDSIHSVVKESVNNTTRGIYMDNDGQLNVGDAFHFIKFYKDTDDTYKLAISADEVIFGSSRKNLQDALDEVANGSISDVDVEYCKSSSPKELLETVTTEGIKTALRRELKGDSVSVRLQSDNLLTLPYDNNFANVSPSTDATVTSNGVTFKQNANGSISIWGTAKKQINYYLHNYQSDSNTSRVCLAAGTYTIGITGNASPKASVRIFTNRYTERAVYDGAPGTFTIDSDGASTLTVIGITITTAFTGITEDNPVTVYPMLNEGDTLKDFTTPKTKALTDSVSYIPDTNCVISVNGNAGTLALNETKTLITNDSLSTIYVESPLNYRIIILASKELTSSAWSTDPPTWENGIYIWSRTKTTSADGTVAYSDPVCITGNTGRSVGSIIEQYYLSTSEVEPTGGDWTNEQPTWSTGSYIWTRSFVTWSDDTTSTTAPVLAQAINDANANAEQASSDADKANTAAADARDVADRAYSEISKLNDAIKNLVVGKDGSTLMTQTADGWQFNFGNFKDTIDDIGKKTAYVHIDETDTGNPKIELGKVDNKAKLALTNEDIQFVVGSEIPTKVTNEGIDTDKIKVDDELAMGNFVWKKRANGNLGLSWKGAGS